MTRPGTSAGRGSSQHTLDGLGDGSRTGCQRRPGGQKAGAEALAAPACDDQAHVAGNPPPAAPRIRRDASAVRSSCPALSREGRASSRELSSRTMVTNGNVTGLVERLEADGTIIRERLEDDKRVTVARLSEKGRTYFEGMAEAHERWIKEMMARGRARRSQRVLCRAWSGQGIGPAHLSRRGLSARAIALVASPPRREFGHWDVSLFIPAEIRCGKT